VQFHRTGSHLVPGAMFFPGHAGADGDRPGHRMLCFCKRASASQASLALDGSGERRRGDGRGLVSAGIGIPKRAEKAIESKKPVPLSNSRAGPAEDGAE
jgi:hypothetical protein